MVRTCLVCQTSHWPSAIGSGKASEDGERTECICMSTAEGGCTSGICASDAGGMTLGWPVGCGFGRPRGKLAGGLKNGIGIGRPKGGGRTGSWGGRGLCATKAWFLMTWRRRTAKAPMARKTFQDVCVLNMSRGRSAKADWEAATMSLPSSVAISSYQWQVRCPSPAES